MKRRSFLTSLAGGAVGVLGLGSIAKGSEKTCEEAQVLTEIETHADQTWTVEVNENMFAYYSDGHFAGMTRKLPSGLLRYGWVQTRGIHSVELPHTSVLNRPILQSLGDLTQVAIHTLGYRVDTDFGHVYRYCRMVPK